ncbi:MAG: hypothetical protein HDT32_06700 [Clostridiales bacterium]|nr:hypothetical protein [Clostridiales bacterium]
MNKKTKIIIAVSVIVFVATMMGVLYWGLQPVQKESVTLEKLNKKLGTRYFMPSELPFDGEVECYIIYVMGNMGVVLTRFEISSKRSTGYSIKLKDSNREIYIGIDGIAMDVVEEGFLIENYNNQTIYYNFLAASDTSNDKTLMIQFKIDGETYHISAKYNKDVNSETMKSDMECILDQMIKQ